MDRQIKTVTAGRILGDKVEILNGLEDGATSNCNRSNQFKTSKRKLVLAFKSSNSSKQKK
jgi:hypothetical protein